MYHEKLALFSFFFFFFKALSCTCMYELDLYGECLTVERLLH